MESRPASLAQSHDAAAGPAERPWYAASALRGLASGAFWLLAANITYSACQWAALMALAKSLPAASLGHFGLSLAIATPVVLVTGFALRAVQANDVQHRYSFPEYMTVRVVGNVIAVIIIGTVAIVGCEPAAAAVLIPIGIAKLAEATSETCYGLAQRHDRMRSVGIAKATRGALGLVALVAVVAVGGTLAEGAWALAATWTAFLVLIDLTTANALEPLFVRPRPSALWRLARESVPLGASNGVSALMQSVPRYLLQVSHGAAAVGYFTAVASIGPALDQLAGSVGHAAAPRLGWAAAMDGRRFRRLVVVLFGLAAGSSALLAAGAGIGGKAFLRTAYTVDYAPYAMALTLVIVAGGFTMMNSVSFFALVATRRLFMPASIQCLGLVATAACGVVLIPRFAVTGAAAALAVGTGIMTAVAAHVILSGRENLPRL